VYSFYLDKVRLPVAPAKVEMRFDDKLARLDLTSGREIAFPVTRGLREIRFTAMLPQVRYPFAVYEGGFKCGNNFLSQIRKLKDSGKPVRFIIVRKTPQGQTRPSTNINVVISQIHSSETAVDGSDINAAITLVQYRDFSVKKVKSKSSVKKSSPTLPAGSKKKVKKHKVVKGDSLWLIAHRLLDNGNRWKEIYNLNKSLIDTRNKGTGNPSHTIYPGQELRIP
jgi:LysM repeat protein